MDVPLITLPAIAKHSHTVIFLHAEGQTARSISSVLTWSTDSRDWSLVHNYPSFRWVFPTWPSDHPSPSVAAGRSSPRDSWSYADLADRTDLEVAELRRAVSALRRVVVDEARRLRWRWDRVILAGLSQGAVTALHALLSLDMTAHHPALGKETEEQTRPGRLGALLCFSCGTPSLGQSLADTRVMLGLDRVTLGDDDVLRNTPILLEHCADDSVVDAQTARSLRDQLRSWGATVTWEEYPDGGHWLNSPRGVDDARAFLLASLGVDTPNIARLSLELGVGLVHSGFVWRDRPMDAAV